MTKIRTMDFAALISELKSKQFREPEGEDILEIKFLPGLSDEQIEKVRTDWCPSGRKLPKDLIELLKVCSGIECSDEIHFDGRPFGQTSEFAMPDEIMIAFDGFGNSWNIYPSAEQDELSPIFFVSHDPPVIVFQCFGVERFIKEWAKWYTTEETSEFGQMMGDLPNNIYFGFKGLPLAKDLQDSADPVMSEFCASLEDGYRVADLRNPTFGMGIFWAPPFNDREVSIKHPTEYIFASRPDSHTPASEGKKKGFFARLFGR